MKNCKQDGAASESSSSTGTEKGHKRDKKGQDRDSIGTEDVQEKTLIEQYKRVIEQLPYVFFHC